MRHRAIHTASTMVKTRDFTSNGLAYLKAKTKTEILRGGILAVLRMTKIAQDDISFAALGKVEILRFAQDDKNRSG